MRGEFNKVSKVKKVKILVLLAGLLCCSCSRTSTAPIPAVRLDSLLAATFPADGPGALMMVFDSDSVLYTGTVGLATLDPASPVTDSTMFNICSVSKQFAAAALLRLQEQGLLSLSDSVSKYFPQFESPVFRRITLAHLLSHTSGIPDARPRTEEQWRRYRLRNESIFDSVADFRRLSLEDESVRYMVHLDSLAFEPGTAYEYQNPTYQLVYYIVEQVTGVPFDRWMHDNIFGPAGMKRTVYFEPHRQIPDMAHGYERTGGSWHESDYGEANFFPTKADGGIYTDGHDYARWLQSLFGGKVLSDSLLMAATTPVIATDIPDTGYGYGFFIEQRPDAPRKVYHTGDNGGFFIYEAAFPERNLFYLVFSNQNEWVREDFAAKVDSILF